jgi:PilZ domain
MDDVTHSSIELGEVSDRRKGAERRRLPRRKTWKNGRTLWSNGDSSECVIRNLSETGAQLELRGPIPNRFDLHVEGDQWRRSCSVVWRKENRAGVKFNEPLPLSQHEKKPVRNISGFRYYISACSQLAGRAAPEDRALLLEMAQAWRSVIRRLERSAREAV